MSVNLDPDPSRVTDLFSPPLIQLLLLATYCLPLLLLPALGGTAQEIRTLPLTMLTPTTGLSSVYLTRTPALDNRIGTCHNRSSIKTAGCCTVHGDRKDMIQKSCTAFLLINTSGVSFLRSSVVTTGAKCGQQPDACGTGNVLLPTLPRLATSDLPCATVSHRTISSSKHRLLRF
ncbi:hypothetical protein J6590_042362 [Homalodisca vitripennis]|nr:hypothetical protein J6590_042362 [Homalodisca vitripennis]